MQLPQGFSHVGDGRLNISEEHLLKLKTPRDINEVYEVANTCIAKGMYGIVRGAVSKQSGISYAAKFLRRRRRGQCCLNEINHEIAVLMLCADSDHVVKLQAVHETRSEIALIMELATGGELQTVIEEQGHLEEHTTRVCMREILRALQHMHSKSIAHLDLKPQNILLTGKSVDDGLKLCDFGVARLIAEKNKIYEIVGTPDYVAPEVLHYDPLSLQTDIWSIGVVAYVLLTGSSPFGGDSKQETFLNITKCSLTFPDDLFDGISSDAIDFIKSVLRIKPKDRLTLDECFEHRWLKEDTVCLREEMLAARASAAHDNKSDTRAVMNENNGIDDGSYDEAVVGNGNGYGIEPVRLHETNTKQKVLTAVDGSSNNTASFSVPAEEDWCEAGGGDGGGGGGGEGGGGIIIRKTSSPAEVKLIQGSQRDITTIAEENKENVIVVGGLVTRSLFPDAPTTPKVSRKTLPVEPLNDGHHYPHHHHHHHNHNHQQPHHLHQNNFAAHHMLNHNHQLPNTHNAATMVTGNSSSSNGASAVPLSNGNGGGNINTSLHATSFASRQGSPSCVKKIVQMMHIHSPVMHRAASSGSSCSNSSSEIMVLAKPCDEYGVEISCPILTPLVPEWKETDEVNENGSGNAATVGCTNGTNKLAIIPGEMATISSCTNETTTNTITNSFSASVTSTVGSSCRAKVVAAATLCTLQCTESSVIGADDRQLTPTSKTTLQQSDKDAITC